MPVPYGTGTGKNGKAPGDPPARSRMPPGTVTSERGNCHRVGCTAGYQPLTFLPLRLIPECRRRRDRFSPVQTGLWIAVNRLPTGRTFVIGERNCQRGWSSGFSVSRILTLQVVSPPDAVTVPLCVTVPEKGAVTDTRIPGLSLYGTVPTFRTRCAA